MVMPFSRGKVLQNDETGITIASFEDTILDSVVLVLNQNFEPLNVCRTRRAISLVILGKAYILENGRGIIRTPSIVFPCPSVIKLAYMIRRPRPKLKLTRQAVFHRDNYACQYCGRPSDRLTIDHVIPRYLGGAHDWENVVSACPTCNRKKGGRTPAEAQMSLIKKPYRPKATGLYVFHRYLGEHTQWQKFIQGWG